MAKQTYIVWAVALLLGAGILTGCLVTSNTNAEQCEIIIVTADAEAAGTEYGTANITADITTAVSQEDIATEQILKDASATAIYGTRGSNGVIIITNALDNVKGMSDMAKRSLVRTAAELAGTSCRTAYVMDYNEVGLPGIAAVVETSVLGTPVTPAILETSALGVPAEMSNAAVGMIAPVNSWAAAVTGMLPAHIYSITLYIAGYYFV